MKTRQLALGLVGIVALVIAFEVGLHLQISRPPHNPNKRVITISAASEPGKCDVDFPVAVLHYNQNHSVQWASNDNKYWISFSIIDYSPEYPPPNPPYTPENPLLPKDELVVIEPHGQSREYHVKPKAKYYQYAIFDHDPVANHGIPCKYPTDEKDTGLNIKP
jgi:hypothetical protein